MKIGLYGGSFDPIHCAHLIIAQFVLAELELDKVLFIPSANPPHKKMYADASDRLAMVHSAVHGNPDFVVSEIEAQDGRTSYSVDTIAALSQEHGTSRENLYWIIGSDNFVDLPAWKNPEGIFNLSTVTVFPRNGVDFSAAREDHRKKALLLHDAPRIDISSTMIRSLLSREKSIRYLVPGSVAELIVAGRLYS